MRINFELSELQAFVAVAEKLNFRAAAEALFISQPALSRRIDKLEQSLQVRLLDRTTRRVSLTGAGEQFMAQARDALATLEGAVTGLHDRARRRAGLVTLACIPSLANHLLPGVLLTFAQAYPDTRIRVIDESAPVVLRSVVDGIADFGLNFLGAQDPSIEFRTICREKYLLALHPGHRWAGRDSIAWPELADERFISVSTASGNRMLIDNAMAQVSVRPSVLYEANHIEAALAMVEAGLGVAAIPQFALANRSPAQIATVSLVRPAIGRTLGLVLRKGHRAHPAAAFLMSQLVKAVRLARRD